MMTTETCPAQTAGNASAVIALPMSPTARVLLQACQAMLELAKTNLAFARDAGNGAGGPRGPRAKRALLAVKVASMLTDASMASLMLGRLDVPPDIEAELQGLYGFAPHELTERVRQLVVTQSAAEAFTLVSELLDPNTQDQPW